MRLDKYSNPIFSDSDLFDALYSGHQIPSEIFVEPSQNTKSLEEVSNLKFWEPIDNYDIPIEEYDQAMSSNWSMPDDYKNLNIEEWILAKCDNQRVRDELEAFKARNMLDLLRWLKYFVDTCSKEGVVWGVGRGSSVASYVLFLIGVHNIDSIKYNLDWQEFLR